jgi:NitT/TauT family transport system substrate-binding protein
MHKGHVSGAVGTPALAIALKTYADGRTLYPPSRIWPNNPSYGIITESKFLEKERKLIEDFLSVHEEATAFLRDKPVEAASIISDYVGLVDEKFVFDVLKVSPKYCAQITDEYISTTMEFAKILKRLGYISRVITSDEIFDTALIQKIHPSKDHY